MQLPSCFETMFEECFRHSLCIYIYSSVYNEHVKSLYVFACVSMYVCMHTNICVENVCMYVSMYVCMHGCIWMYVCIHIYIYDCLYVCVDVCMYVCMHVCIYAVFYEPMYVYG